MEALNFHYERNGLTRADSRTLEQTFRVEAEAAFWDRDYDTANKLIDTANQTRRDRQRQQDAPSADFGEPAMPHNRDTERILAGLTAAERLGIRPKKGDYWR